MANLLNTPNSILTINGVQVPSDAWNVHLASHGSLGTITAETSFSQLSLMGIDIASLGESGAQISLSAGFKETSTKLIFGGYYDSHKINPGKDRCIISGRDWAADLVDKTQVIAGYNYKNQTAGQLVSQIATNAGMGLNVTDPGILVGSSYNQDTAFLSHPQQLWAVVKNLADQFGFDCHVTPDRTLYFGPIDESVGSLIVTYGATAQQNLPNPVENLEIDHNARRNGNFEVHVLSYDPYTNQLTSSSAVSAAQTISGSVSDVNAHGSKKGKSATSQPAHGKGEAVVLTFHIDGLTAAQCQDRAKGIARDIAKREIIIHGSIIGLPSAVIHQTLQINSPNQGLAGYENRSYVVADVTHSYSRTAGFRSQFIAMNQPTET
jgi:phage protein D